MRARIEPMAAAEDLDIPLPAMAPSYRTAAPQRRTAMDTGTKRLAIFAGGIGGALVLLVGVWSFTGHHHAGVPVIEADSRPLRVKPANPGGLQVDGANDSILSGEADGKEAMAPPPETPAPQTLKAEEQAAAAPPPPAPSATVTPPAPAPLAAVAPPKPAPIDLKPAAPAKPVVLASAKPMPMPPAAAAGGTLVQLAAVDSEDAARAEWKRLTHKYGDMLANHTPTFSRTEHAGKTFWRVRTGGFADTAQAVLFCDRIKAKGGGCSVASF
jgi:hypothetical protein